MTRRTPAGLAALCAVPLLAAAPAAFAANELLETLAQVRYSTVDLADKTVRGGEEDNAARP